MDLTLKLVNIGLVVLFVLLIICFIVAALRGFARGIWKSTHNMIFMLSLIVICFVTLDAFTNFVSQFPINLFLKGSFYITRESGGVTSTYYVEVTNLKETLNEYLKGLYLLYNVSVSEQSAASFALALTNSILKVAVVIIDMVLIVTLGNLLCLLSWVLVFRHLIPKVARKRIKVRWVGLVETLVTFTVVTFLFMTPFTAIVNSVNQAYKRNDVQNKADNEMVINIGNFVNAYDNSLFAKVFFNWSVDDKGMTYDAHLLDTFTTGISGDYTINIVREIVNIVDVLGASVGAVHDNEDGGVTIEIGALITEEIVNKGLDAVMNSSMLQIALPIVVEVALNSELLGNIIPGALVDLSDVNWKEEIGYIKEMANVVFSSGALDDLFYEDEHGYRVMHELKGNELVTFVEDLVYSEHFNEYLEVFRTIDKSKALSRAIPALIYSAINSDDKGTVNQFLPLTWEELNEFSWGYEMYALLDVFHQIAALDNNFLRAIFVKTGLYTPAESDTTNYNLAHYISAYASGFRKAIVGEFDTSGNPKYVDSHGQTIVLDENGNRKADRNFCLFDMNIVAKVVPTLLDNLFDLDALSGIKSSLNLSDLNIFHQAVAELSNGEQIINYKKEFDAIYDAIEVVAQDEELMSKLIEGKPQELMPDQTNVFSIDVSHINYLKQAINKMDRSKILYGALAPMLKSLFANQDVSTNLGAIGLNTDVMISAIEQDMDKTNHALFSNISSLLDCWDDLNNIQSLSNASANTNALMEELKKDSIISSLKNCLKLIVDNPLLNPTPRSSDQFEKNENLFGILEFVFSNTESYGLTVTRDLLRSVESGSRTWHNEIDAIVDSFQFIAVHDIINASTALSGGLTHAAVDKLVGHTDDDYYIKGLFDCVESSYIFSNVLGPFLDDMLGDSLNGFLVDESNHITFSNITNWSTEGQNIENLLKSLDHIVPDGDDNTSFFENLDLTSLTQIVDLNAMLHDIAHSGIFTYVDNQNVTHYQFGKWLYNILNSSLGSFSVDEHTYDLLCDPKFDDDSLDSWKWGNRPEDVSYDEVLSNHYYYEWLIEYNPDLSLTDTHYIAYQDFVYANGIADTNPDIVSFWCDYDAFVSAQKAFIGGEYGDEFVAPASYLTNDWGAYFGSDEFTADYESVFAIDEISRVTRFACYAMRILQPRTDATKIPFDEIPKDLLDNMLFSLNETSCLRVGIYNFYRIAAENFFNNYSSSGFSLASAYSTYIIDVDRPMNDFDTARPLRRQELSRFTALYDLINVAKDEGVLSGGNFVFENMRNGNFLDTFEETLKAMNDSYVFHLKGSSKVGQLTVFQGLFNHLLGDSEIGSSIYLGNNSPKDANNTFNYNSASSKIKYLVEKVFPDDPNPGARDSQKQEITRLVDIIDNLYSLKTSGGQVATSIADADLSDDDNIIIIHDVLGILNQSNLLCDLVPNTIYKLFISEPQFSVTSGTESIDFSRADPFYHYYFNVNTLNELSTPNFNARYSQRDIDGIEQLLLDYAAFNTTLGTNSFTDANVLKNLTGTLDSGNHFQSTGPLSDLLYTLHDNPIFHTPARNYTGYEYYTNTFATGYTLFEETMAKICIFVGLDEFAYESGVDSESSAREKLDNRLTYLTLTDDGYASGLGYHVTQGEAWEQEIHSIMATAFYVADASSGSIDFDNFELEDLTPLAVKNVLTSVNSSDLICDAVPNFVKDGFEGIGLGDLTSYNSVNYANYRIGQTGYGGADGAANGGSEIYNIYDVLLTLRDGNTYVSNMSDISTFVSNDPSGNRLHGLIRYIYESRILNTPVGGTYNSFYQVDGHSISDQGVLLFNVLDNSGLSGFIARDALTSTAESTDLQKIEQLSAIIHMPTSDGDAISAGLTYEIESEGLYRLIDTTNTYNIDADVFTGAGHDDINNVKDNYRDPVLAIIEIAYNADNYGHRSAIVSEFVSGLLNNVLENEYNDLNNKAGYAYNQFTFGKPVSQTVVKYSHYASLNVTEKNGLEGILNSLDYAGQLNPLTLPSMSDDERHTMADALEQCFALMTTDGHNSEIARIVYLNDFHSVLKTISAIPNRDSQTFVGSLVNETSTSELENTRTVYSSNFFFSSYGTAIKNYIYPGFF